MQQSVGMHINSSAIKKPKDDAIVDTPIHNTQKNSEISKHDKDL